MTESRQPGIDAEMIEGGRRRWMTALVAAVVGLIAGAVLGTLIGSTKPSSVSAAIDIQITPDSSIDSQLQSSAQDGLDAQSYIQGELVTLNGAQLAATVHQKLGGGAPPSIVASEVGQTYVVQVSTTAAKGSRARRAAQLAAAAYRAERQKHLSNVISDALNSVHKRTDSVQARLNDAERKQPANAAATPSETALQTEYERLLSLTSTLSSALSSTHRVVTVINPARVTPATLSTSAKWAAGGGLVGAVIGLVVLFGARRAIPRFRTIGDLAALSVPVIFPILPRQRRGARASWPSGAARILATRLSADNQTSPLVIVGTSSRVGTTFVAASLAAAVAEQGPVLLVSAEIEQSSPANATMQGAATDSTPSGGDGSAVKRHPVHPSTIEGVWLLPDGLNLVDGAAVLPSTRSRVLVDALNRASRAGWRVIVDARALSESSFATDCLATGASVALVVGRGVSRPEDVVSSVELFEARGAGGFAGVVVNNVPRGLSRRMARRRKPVVAIDARGDESARPVDAKPDDSAPTDDINDAESRRPLPHRSDARAPEPSKS